MLCPNCESGEMSTWFGQAICSNCQYAIGPEPVKPVVLIASDIEIMNPSPEDLAGRQAISMAMMKSPEEIANIEHNQWRYNELQKLRMGQPNQYRETRYR